MPGLFITAPAVPEQAPAIRAQLLPRATTTTLAPRPVVARLAPRLGYRGARPQES